MIRHRRVSDPFLFSMHKYYYYYYYFIRIFRLVRRVLCELYIYICKYIYVLNERPVTVQTSRWQLPFILLLVLSLKISLSCRLEPKCYSFFLKPNCYFTRPSLALVKPSQT